MLISAELSRENKPYYITTAIDYPNAAPHLGHTLEKVAADVIARYHRLRGRRYVLQHGTGREQSTRRGSRQS